MIITLEKRTADSVRTYFEKANRPEIKQVLPQKAKTGPASFSWNVIYTYF